MAHLALYLLGGFHATLDDQPLGGIYDHVRALLAILAAEPDRAHRREALAELLWPHEEEDVARRNLRQALSRLRTALGDRDAATPHLHVDRSSIQFNTEADHFLDLSAFNAVRHLLKSADDQALAAELPWLEEACRHYRGEFLARFHLPDNPEFEAWQSAMREDYGQLAQRCLQVLADHYESMGETDRAVDYARRQVEAEPWLERAHRQLMRLFLASGQRSAALAQYNACVAALNDELGVAPEAVTEALAEQARSGEGKVSGLPAQGSETPATEPGRRHVAVLFAAVSEPGGMDPEDFLEVAREFKQACRRLAARFEAHARDSHGASQILVFGFPRAHEDDADRAAMVALSLIEEGRRLARRHRAPLAVRAGLHAGLMVVDTTQDETLAGDLIGTPLDLAVQLRYHAPANTILTSAAVERLLRRRFLLRRMAISAGAECAAALPAFEIRGELDEPAAPVADGASDPGLVGRHGELEWLRRHWIRVDSEGGRVLLIDGEPGVGKSHLLNTWERALSQTGVPFRRVACTAEYQTGPAPLVVLLHQMLGLAQTAAQTSKLERIAHWLAESEGDYNAAVARLMGIDAGAPEAGPDSHRRRQKALELLADSAIDAAHQQASVWVVEDIQWVDPSTAEFLETLIARLGPSRILLVFTARPGFELAWRIDPARFERLRMEPLGSDDARRLADSIVGGRGLPAALGEEIIRRTDGVPLFVEELTKSLLDSGAIQARGDEVVMVGALSEIRLPFTLHDSVTARLDRLGRAKTVAQRLSVLGRESRREHLESLCDSPPALVHQEVQRLQEAELLYCRQEGERTVYGFRHALIQQVAYESMLRREREHLHVRAATMLLERDGDEETAPEIIAYHFGEAGASEAAVDWWINAGRRAIARFAYAEAIEFLRSGLALIDDLDPGPRRDHRELELQLSLGMPLMLLWGPVEEVGAAYERALELSRNLPTAAELFPALRGLYTYYAGVAEYATAKDLAERCIAVATESGDNLQMVEAQRTLGTVHLLRGELAEAQAHLERSWGLYDPDSHERLALAFGMDSGLAANALLAVADWARGRTRTAAERLAHTLDRARRLRNPSTLGWVLNLVLTVEELRGHYAALEERAGELARLAAEMDSPIWTLWSRAMASRARALNGGRPSDHEEAAAALTEYLHLGAAMGRPYAEALRVDTALRLGRELEAQRLVTDALAWCEAQQARLHTPDLTRLQGRLLAGLGHPAEQVAAAYRQALDVAVRAGSQAFALRAAVDLGEQMAVTDPREAAALVDEAVRAMPEADETADRRQARSLLARLGQDTPV